MSTIKERRDYQREVVDRQLTPAQKHKIASADDQVQFLAERKAVMQRWTVYLDSVASGNVTPTRAKWPAGADRAMVCS